MLRNPWISYNMMIIITACREPGSALSDDVESGDDATEGQRMHVPARCDGKRLGGDLDLAS